MVRKHATFKAVLTMVSAIVGAGIFGLPTMFAYIGFWPGTILFGFMACLTIATHLFMVEIVLTHKHHSRLTGYAGKELGPLAHWISAWTFPLQMVGSCVAYIILAGEFLTLLSSYLGFSLPLIAWQVIFWLGGALIVFFGLKMVAKIESHTVWILMALMVVAAVVATSVAPADTVTRFFTTWNPAWAPFGVFLFALSGLPAVGEVVDLVGHHPRNSYRVVLLGTAAAAILSWIFGTALAMSSPTTALTGDPIDLMRALPSVLSWLIPLIGFIAVSGTFVMMSQSLRSTLHIDFRIPSRAAWYMAMITPFAIMMVINRDFISVIGAIGAIFGAINGILTALIFIKICERRRTHEPLYMFVIPVVVILAYVTGMVQKLFF